MQYAIYVLIKFAFYVGWCWLGLAIWQPDSESRSKPFWFGLLRLAIGVLFGVTIFIAFPAQADDALAKYLEIYTPVRFIEWLILAWLISLNSDDRKSSNVLAWTLGGIVVSFVADFASPQGVAGHFCIGRCLC